MKEQLAIKLLNEAKAFYRTNIWEVPHEPWISDKVQITARLLAYRIGTCITVQTELSIIPEIRNDCLNKNFYVLLIIDLIRRGYPERCGHADIKEKSTYRGILRVNEDLNILELKTLVKAKLFAAMYDLKIPY